MIEAIMLQQVGNSFPDQVPNGGQPFLRSWAGYQTNAVFTLHVSPPSLCSCAVYSGTVCTRVFSTANITFADASIFAADSMIAEYLERIREVSEPVGISEACQSYLRLSQCLLRRYSPCSGYAWCGSVSRNDLTTAIRTACGCNSTIDETSICRIGGLTDVPPLSNYYQGSSSTGSVGSALACLDVNIGKSCRHRCTPDMPTVDLHVKVRLVLS